MLSRRPLQPGRQRTFGNRARRRPLARSGLVSERSTSSEGTLPRRGSQPLGKPRQALFAARFGERELRCARGSATSTTSRLRARDGRVDEVPRQHHEVTREDAARRRPGTRCPGSCGCSSRRRAPSTSRSRVLVLDLALVEAHASALLLGVVHATIDAEVAVVDLALVVVLGLHHLVADAERTPPRSSDGPPGFSAACSALVQRDASRPGPRASGVSTWTSSRGIEPEALRDALVTSSSDASRARSSGSRPLDDEEIARPARPRGALGHLAVAGSRARSARCGSLAACRKICSSRTVGTAPAVDDVAEHGARADRRELVDVADDDEARGSEESPGAARAASFRSIIDASSTMMRVGFERAAPRRARSAAAAGRTRAGDGSSTRVASGRLASSAWRRAPSARRAARRAAPRSNTLEDGAHDGRLADAGAARDDDDLVVRGRLPRRARCAGASSTPAASRTPRCDAVERPGAARDGLVERAPGGAARARPPPRGAARDTRRPPRRRRAPRAQSASSPAASTCA